jgi:hypothetical protein
MIFPSSNALVRGALAATFGYALCFCQTALAQAPAPAAPPAPAVTSSQRQSSLPAEALEKAREAEKHLAANAPDKAIAILKDLDKAYPGHSAISLRLAQIYDTLNSNGYALFYYRRYVAQAGNKARPLAVERVSTLELVAGVNAQVEKVEKELGEDSRPVSTPAPKVQRMLATTAKDGSLVPIRNEKDFERLQREGVPQTSPVTPVPTPANTPIVLPSARTPAPAVPDSSAAPSREGEGNQSQPQNNPGTPADQATPSRTRVSISSAAAATPRPPDEDALLAQAFSKADSPDAISAKVTETIAPLKPNQATPSDDQPAPRLNMAPTTAADLPPLAATPLGAKQNASQPDSRRAPAPVSPRLTPASSPPAQIAFTKATPAFSSPKAASFFNVTAATGQYALVSVINEVPASVVTLSITPRNDGEVISAILASKEQKRVYVRPGTYDVSANISTTDYSPITLMSTHFEYTFSAGQQYTRRFNKTNIQQLN